MGDKGGVRHVGNLSGRRMLLGMEEYLKDICGVLSTQVGYANGTTKNPTYEDVCCRSTGACRNG
jgi:hypothetical protein